MRAWARAWACEPRGEVNRKSWLARKVFLLGLVFPFSASVVLVVRVQEVLHRELVGVRRARLRAVVQLIDDVVVVGADDEIRGRVHVLLHGEVLVAVGDVRP